MVSLSTDHIIVGALVAVVLYKMYDETTQMKAQVNSMERYLVTQARSVHQTPANAKKTPRLPPRRNPPGMSSGDDNDVPAHNSFGSDDDEVPQLKSGKGGKPVMGINQGNQGSSEAITDSMLASNPMMGRH
jgi:hypothetical protein